MSKLFILLSLIVAFNLSAIAQSDIRKVDFKNFTYDVQIFETKEKLTLKNGEFDRNTEEEKLFFSVEVESYGDIDGDGKEEAVVTTMMNTGGTGNFSGGIIFTMKGGKPVILTEFEGGDRAYGGLVSAKIVEKELIVVRNDPGETGGACCAEFHITSKYKWDGKGLAQVGEDIKRELYPLNRITFNKGASASTVSLKLEKYDRKRYVIGGGKGQTLTISSVTKGVGFTFHNGEGDAQYNDNGMTVKLNETGDFVFDISNDTDQGMEFSIKVEIK
jgi:hypothetical protein